MSISFSRIDQFVIKQAYNATLGNNQPFVCLEDVSLGVVNQVKPISEKTLARNMSAIGVLHTISDRGMFSNYPVEYSEYKDLSEYDDCGFAVNLNALRDYVNKQTTLAPMAGRAA